MGRVTGTRISPVVGTLIAIGDGRLVERGHATRCAGPRSARPGAPARPRVRPPRSFGPRRRRSPPPPRAAARPRRRPPGRRRPRRRTRPRSRARGAPASWWGEWGRRGSLPRHRREGRARDEDDEEGSRRGFTAARGLTVKTNTPGIRASGRRGGSRSRSRSRPRSGGSVRRATSCAPGSPTKTNFRPEAANMTREGSHTPSSILRKARAMSRLATEAPRPKATLIFSVLRISARTSSRSSSSTQMRPASRRRTKSASRSRLPGTACEVEDEGRPSVHVLARHRLEVVALQHLGEAHLRQLAGGAVAQDVVHLLLDPPLLLLRRPPPESGSAVLQAPASGPAAP